MAWHHRHVSRPALGQAVGDKRTIIPFIRRDLLYAPDEPIQNPYQKRMKLRIPLRRAGLKYNAKHIYMGPNLVDLVVRVPVEGEGGISEQVWRLRDPAEFFVAPKDRKKLGSEEHPFVKRLCTGGTFVDYDGGFIEVTKQSSVSVSTQVYRLAMGMLGSWTAASQRIGALAAAAWDADLIRARDLYDLIVAEREILDHEVPPEFKATATISQTVESTILRDTCKWLGVDPDVPVERRRGRPRGQGRAADGSETMAGEVIELTLHADESVMGRLIQDYQTVAKGTSLSVLQVSRLAGMLVGFRDQELSEDADLLEAYLDAVSPDWREEIAGDLGGPETRGLPDDPWSLLGLEPDASEAEVKRSYRKIMRAVHPDTSGLPDWISKTVNEAHRQVIEEIENG